jgi:hypothetical protein
MHHNRRASGDGEPWLTLKQKAVQSIVRRSIVRSDLTAFVRPLVLVFDLSKRLWLHLSLQFNEHFLTWYSLSALANWHSCPILRHPLSMRSSDTLAAPAAISPQQSRGSFRSFGVTLAIISHTAARICELVTYAEACLPMALPLKG